MNKKWLLGIVIGLGLFGFSIGSARAGGWAVLTLESWPGTVVAGEPFNVRYVLRQHGQTLVAFDEGGMEPMITAVNLESGESVKFEVQPTSKIGYYEAEIMLPQAGTWEWSIDAFGRFDMPPLTVVSAAATEKIDASSQTAKIVFPATANYWAISAIGVTGIAVGLYLWFRQKVRYAPLLGLAGVTLCLVGFTLIPTKNAETAVAQPLVQPSAEMGKILFQAKGCTTCHQHDGVSYGQSIRIGPNLTNHDVSAEFLRVWLRDPAQIRPKTLMPDLELTDAEIESLIAFLQAAQARK